MKRQTYTTPQSNVLKFELRDSLLFLPQSEPGGDQLSGKKDYADDDAAWSSEGWSESEEG